MDISCCVPQILTVPRKSDKHNEDATCIMIIILKYAQPKPDTATIMH